MAKHPITPPPELVREWASESLATQHLCTQAARWGADQELEACCEYIAEPGKWFVVSQFRVAELRAARRPKPPTLKEQALESLRFLGGNSRDVDTIRRALEALPE